MAGGRDRIASLLHERSLARWSKAARRAPMTGLGRLGRDRDRALELRQQLDEVLATAAERLAPVEDTAPPAGPLGTDWVWRPAIFRRPVEPSGRVAPSSGTMLDPGTTLFHDCPAAELSLRQITTDGPVRFATCLDVYGFDGSFLSLALDLPVAAAAGLRKRHLIRLSMVIETERPLEVFARLNLRHGPNTEQMVRELPGPSGTGMVEFDLAYTRLNEKRVDHLWLDLIFEGPRMNRITLRDVTFARYPRAEI